MSSSDTERVAAPRAEVLDPSAATADLATSQAQHPTVWEELNTLMTSLHGVMPDCETPLVRITLRENAAVNKLWTALRD